MKNPDKAKQCSKQTCLQIIVLLNITTNSSIINGRQKYNNNTTITNVNNDVNIYRDFEKPKP